MNFARLVKFFFLFNVFLFLFSTLAIYSLDVNLKIAEDAETGDQFGLVRTDEGKSLIILVLEVGGVGAIGAALAGIVAHFLSGVTGLQSISLVILIGFFSGLFYNTFNVIQGLASWFGEFSFVISIFMLFTSTIFVISLIDTVRQMGAGGDRAYV